MDMDMTATLDLENVEKFIHSDKFSQFLLSNTTDFVTAVFVLQTLIEKVEELKNH